MPAIGLEPAYKQHAVVDDVRDVVLDVEVTTGETNEGQVVIERIDAAAATTGTAIKTLTADAGYAYAKVYGGSNGAGSTDDPGQSRADQECPTASLRRAKNDMPSARVENSFGRVRGFPPPPLLSPSPRGKSPGNPE